MTVLCFLCNHRAHSFITPLRTPSNSIGQTYSTVILSEKNRKSSFLEQVDLKRIQQLESGAGVAGAEFFGGEKQKESLYDAEAELNADKYLLVQTQPEEEHLLQYDRYLDVNAFPDEKAKTVAQALQRQINECLYLEDAAAMEAMKEESSSAITTDSSFTYSSNLNWQTTLTIKKESKTPLDELTTALDFYRRVDLAIISAKSKTDTLVEMRWELSVLWPTPIQETRVLVTGTSELTLNNEKCEIVRQVDNVDQANEFLSNVLAPQLRPRWWDLYRFGTTPSAELQPMVTEYRSLRYSVQRLQPRLYLCPSILDHTGDREDYFASFLPNHAFGSSIIRTVGPKRQRYITCSPIEVRLEPSKEDPKLNRIVWSLPISVEYQTEPILRVPPDDDPVSDPETKPTTTYEFRPERRVATMAYGGEPQDEQIPFLRKQLYDAVVKDGKYKPKLSEDGRPQFFFWSGTVKVCYTSDGGLGMAYYDWRPEWTFSNAIGLELESTDGADMMKRNLLNGA